MRPKSEIYTPKRDDEHPHPFHLRIPSPPPPIANLFREEASQHMKHSEYWEGLEWSHIFWTTQTHNLTFYCVHHCLLHLPSASCMWSHAILALIFQWIHLFSALSRSMYDSYVDTPVYPVQYGTTEFPHTTPRAWHPNTPSKKEPWVLSLY